MHCYWYDISLSHSHAVEVFLNEKEVVEGFLLKDGFDSTIQRLMCKYSWLRLKHLMIKKALKLSIAFNSMLITKHSNQNVYLSRQYCCKRAFYAIANIIRRMNSSEERKNISNCLPQHSILADFLLKNCTWLHY